MKKVLKHFSVFVLFIAIVLAFSGCGQKNAPINGDKATSTEEIINDNQGNNIEKTEQGEITKEENGWKRYINRNLGIEFRFQDINDEVNIMEGGGGLHLEKLEKDDFPNIYRPYIYLSKEVVLEYYRNEYTNLEDYIRHIHNGRERGDGAGEKILSIQKINNTHSKNFLKVITIENIENIKKVKDPAIRMKYYIEYDNKDYPYLFIGYSTSYNSLDKEIQFLQVINSFKFIN